ncbi:MAG: C_GCAxxG_C_C family protein [Clostridia bacterium]|nr:C_GCAxxG_C_C family protein [Clostridia bacterium]
MDEIKKAGQFFLEGFNCSQSVFTAFCDRFGMDEETAKRVSAGLGGGVGRMREVCGAVSAAAMVLGSVVSAVEGDDAQSKMKNYELVREFSERFRERHGGTVICREMLKLDIPMEKTAMPEDRTAEYYKKRPCLKAVEDAADILVQLIEENK